MGAFEDLYALTEEDWDKVTALPLSGWCQISLYIGNSAGPSTLKRIFTSSVRRCLRSMLIRRVDLC